MVESIPGLSIPSRVVCIGLPLLLLLSACQTNPYTGRSQFLQLSEAQELQLGLEEYPKLTKQYRVISSGHDHAMVNRVMHRLVAKTGKDYAWEVKLLDAPGIINAWALPGGKMAVYTGLLPITQNDAGLAVVMSHEIAHALARHGNERISRGLLIGLGLSIAELSLGQESKHRAEILAGLGVAVGLGIVRPFSRANETEADELGVRLMIEAGYDPYEAIRLWERMAALGSSGPEFLSTHPAALNRAKHLAQIIPQYVARYGKR